MRRPAIINAISGLEVASDLEQLRDLGLGGYTRFVSVVLRSLVALEVLAFVFRGGPIDL
jgi:hypothetical protein